MDNQANFFSEFAKSQEKMWDFWKDMYGNLNPLNQEKGDKASTQNFMDAMMQPMRQFYGAYQTSPYDLWKRMTASSQTYYDLYELYKDMVKKHVEPVGDQIKKNIETWMEKSENALYDIYLPLLPEDMARVFEQAIDLGKTYQSTMTYFWGPWMDNLVPLQDAMAKGMFKDPSGYMDFFEEWKKDYKDTISKILEMPMMGMNRSAEEDILRTTDRYIKLVGYQYQVVGRIMQLAYTNTIKAFEKLLSGIQEGQEVKSFEEFYEDWRESLSHSFDDLFYSDEFSKLLGTYMESFMEFKMAMDKVLEKQLQSLPVVLKTDINSLYKTVYDLKKEVRSLKKQIAELEEKEAAAPKTTRTTRAKTTTTKTEE